MVQLYNPFCQRQSQSVSLDGMRGVPLIKFIENVFLNFMGHADTLILNGKKGGGFIRFGKNRDGTVLGREFYGVVQKVEPDLFQ